MSSFLRSSLIRALLRDLGFPKPPPFPGTTLITSSLFKLKPDTKANLSLFPFEGKYST